MAATKANTTVQTKDKIIITSTHTDVEVLQYDQKGTELMFSIDDFKVLDDEFIAELSHLNRQKYFQARAKRSPTAVRRVQIQSPIADLNIAKLQLPSRDGWHRTWQDGRFVEHYKQVGYRTLYRDGEGNVLSENEKTPEGKTPQVLKIREVEPNGTKHDLVAMEVPMHLYEAHMRANELSERQATQGHKEEFYAKVDELNRSFGLGSKKQIQPFVEAEGE